MIGLITKLIAKKTNTLTAYIISMVLTTIWWLWFSTIELTFLMFIPALIIMGIILMVFK